MGSQQGLDPRMKRRSRSFTDMSDFSSGKVSAFQPYPVNFATGIPWQFGPGAASLSPSNAGLAGNFVHPNSLNYSPLQGSFTALPHQQGGKVAISYVSCFVVCVCVCVSFSTDFLKLICDVCVCVRGNGRSRAPDGITGRPVHIVTKQEKKLAHSAMERRYRKELNMQINQLRMLVPACDDNTASNINKVGVLKKATEYVRKLRQQEQVLVFVFVVSFLAVAYS